MFVCICARVRECEVRSAIRSGARCKESVGDSCGAGTGCGSCLDRICEMLTEADVKEAGSDTQPALTG